MSENDKGRYVSSVYTGRYKSRGKIKNTKEFVDNEQTQKKHNKLIKHNSERRLIKKTIRM